ncbi:MAG: hypothetical protein RLZZ74_2399 [Cyanobacteriota bacterium]|jgi:hypothetical protein
MIYNLIPDGIALHVRKAIAKISYFFQGVRVQSLATIFLASWLLIATDVNSVQSTPTQQPSGKELLERIRQHDQDSQRPKTNGEFLEEARGDIPLNERFSNITRDSKEAFKDLGENVSQGTKENVRDLKNSAAQAGEDLSQGIERKVKDTFD